MPHKVIIVGASGLIGSNLLSQLITSEDITEITILVRKQLGISNPKLKEIVIDFENLNEYASQIQGDILFCCLGTTKSKTPNAQEYRRIDLDYPLSLAKISLQNRVSQFHLVSSMGANPESNSAYLKLKGELETELKKLNIKSIHIYQPSFLEGNRHEKRPIEKIMLPLMKLINPLLLGNWENYRSIKAETVAKAMINQSKKELTGIFTYQSKQIKELA